MQQSLRADHDQRNILALAPACEAKDITNRLRADARNFLEPGVRIRLNPQGSDALAFLQPPSERMFAPSGSKEKDIDGFGASEAGHGDAYCIGQS